MKILVDTADAYNNALRVYDYAVKQNAVSPDADLPTREQIYEAAMLFLKLYTFMEEHEDEFNERFFKE